MPHYSITYNSARTNLVKEVDADTYRITGKFFEFLKDRQIILTIRSDFIHQIETGDPSTGVRPRDN